MGDEFPWYYGDEIVRPGNPYNDPNDYQFYHIFEYEDDLFDLLKNTSLFSLLGATEVIRVKANLNPRTIFNKGGGWHIDYTDDPPIKTSILYLNTNNGYTKFKKGGKVKSVENRIVIFDSNLKHQGVTCTNEQRRVLINFNYEV